MRRLILIRHAVTEWNASGRFQGQTDVALSKAGRAQAEALGKRLASCDIERVYASPLARTLETAGIALPERSLIREPRLMELDFGAFEGRTLGENQSLPEWDWWYADPFNRRAPGGESYRDLQERASAWLCELCVAGQVVAFAHSGTIQMLLAHLLGIPQPRARKRFQLGYTSITSITFHDGVEVIERVNDTSHLCRELQGGQASG